MLHDDGWSRDTLPDLLKLSPEETDAALEELASRAMVTNSADGSVRPVRPSVALARLLDESDRRLRDAQEGHVQARAASELLMEETAHLDVGEHTSLETVEGRDAAGDRVSELLGSARSEVLTMVTTLPSDETVEYARQSDLWLLERGVRTRMLALSGHVRRSRTYHAHLLNLTEHGAEVRVAATLPTRMVIIDGTTAVIPDNADQPERGAIVIQHGTLITLAAQAFESAWNNAGDIRGSGSSHSTEWEPDDLEREVIRLLGSGNKDEAIARRVGMSLRSVRRLISNISTELDTSSRFELGVRCAERGWI